MIQYARYYLLNKKPFKIKSANLGRKLIRDCEKEFI